MVEMNAGQMVEDVRLAADGRVPVHFHGRRGGGVPTTEGNSNDTGGSNGNGTYERDARWGPNDPAVHGGVNHYELVRLTDPSISPPDWL